MRSIQLKNSEKLLLLSEDYGGKPLVFVVSLLGIEPFGSPHLKVQQLEEVANTVQEGSDAVASS